MPTNAGLNSESQTGYSSYIKGILKLPEISDETREELVKLMNESNEIPIIQLPKTAERTYEVWDMTEKSEKVNESQNDLLKPCPFCGSSVELTTPYVKPMGTYIFCPNCRLSINLGFCRSEEDREELTRLWNKRVSQ